MATLMRLIHASLSEGQSLLTKLGPGRGIRAASFKGNPDSSGFLRPQCPGPLVRRKCEWVQPSAETLAWAMQPPHQVSARRAENHVVFLAADLSDVSQVVGCIAE